MHYKVTLKRVQAARINTNISKQLNEHCTNPANKLLCKSVEVTLAVSCNTAQTSENVQVFTLYVTTHKFTYFSLA